MAERKPLTSGLALVPPGTDPEAVRAFVTQEPSEPARRDLPPPESGVANTPSNETIAASGYSPRLARKKRSLPVGLIPVTVRLTPEIASALKRASLERQLAGEDVYTQQDLVQQALEPWLRREGFLP